MKVLVLAALVVAASSGRLQSQGTSQEQWPWLAGHQYTYEVHSHNLARLQEGPTTGSAFKAQFLIRVSSPGRLQAKLVNPQHAQVNQELSRGQQQLPEDLKYQPVKGLDQVFEIFVEGGRVQSLNLPNTVSLSNENLLKGLIGALQVDLSNHRNVESHHDNYNKELYQGLFRKMETDVTGDCETLYSVLPVAAEWRREVPNFATQEEPMEITKSRSYGKCHHRVAYHFGVPQGAEWTGTARHKNENQLMRGNTHARILAAKQGPIYKSEITSTINVHPYMYGKQEAEVISYIRLDLVAYEQNNQGDWQMPEQTRQVQNLLYSISSKQVTIDDNSAESGSVESLETVNENVADDEQAGLRQRRSAQPKIISINKFIINRRHQEDQDRSSSSSSDSTSADVNDDIPNIREPAYAALYMNPQQHTDKKQNPMNAQKLVQELAQQLQNSNNLPKADFLSKFNILVRVLASMSYEQLTLTSRSIEVAKSSNNIMKTDMWMVYRDAVAQAGTLPALQQIRSWIQTKKVERNEAAELVATLVNTLRYPTKEAMTQFFNMAYSDEVKNQMFLNDTALIAATRFINMAQVNNETAHSYYPTHMYGRLSRKHDNFVQEEILPRLRQDLENAIQNQDSYKAQVYIKAIGNLGHRSILEVFAPYLEGKIPVSTYLRTQIVRNLQVLAHQRDHYVRAVLYSLLKNTAEPDEVRVVAIQNIFMARPTTEMLQSMAQMTNDDPSIQVRAVLQSSILSAAKIENPRYLELARTAQAAVPMLTKEDFGKMYSQKIYRESYESEYGLGLMNIISYIAGKDGVFPKDLRFAWKGHNSWNNYNEVAASFSSAQNFGEFLKKQFNFMTERSMPENNHKWNVNKISEMLNIQHNRNNPIEAAFNINFMNQERFFAFGPSNIDQVTGAIYDYLTNLAKGVEKHYTKVFNRAQVSIMVPVANGMPFIYKYKEPTVIHIQAKAKGQIHPGNEKNSFTASMEKELQITYARNIDGSVGFLDTLVDQYASAGVVNKFQVNVPVKINVNMNKQKAEIHLAPLRPEQDTTIVHYSVWPYIANQKKDSLVTISLDPTTKVISRENKVVSTDYKFGQNVGTVFQLQGYSQSQDYRNWGTMFASRDLLSNIMLAITQKDVALTHYNFKYLGKQSQNKAVSLTAFYDEYHNQQQQDSQLSLEAADMQDVTPNSAARREEMVKRVVSGIKTPKAQVVDISASFEGTQKTEYVLTAVIGDSHVDPKVQYLLFAGRNSAILGNTQINAVGHVVKPIKTAINILEALKKELKINFEANIKYEKNGNIQVQGYAERSQKFTEQLKKLPLLQQSVLEIAENNYYQDASQRMLIMAHSPDFLKASVTYKDSSPYVRNMTYQFARIVQHLGFWYTDLNPLKPQPEGKLEIEVQSHYWDNTLSLTLGSKLGELRFNSVPLPVEAVAVTSVYTPFSAYERLMNFYTHNQFQPYCSVDGNKIRTFSSRNYSYTLSKTWHLVMYHEASERQESPQLVIMARRPSDNQQEMYISYSTRDGQNLEIEMQPGQVSGVPTVRVNTNAKKVSEGALTTYWNQNTNSPLFEYYFLDGVMMLHFQENYLRAMYDGQRFVVLAKEGRDYIRGICGRMSSDPRDDYETPNGLVDRPEHYAASFAIEDESADPQTMEYKNQAKQLAYQLRQHYTLVLNSDSQWRSIAQQGGEDWSSWNVYKSRTYRKQKGVCQMQNQVQYYENYGEICITTTPLPACQSGCNRSYQVQGAQVVCQPKLDQQFITYRNQIRQGQNPQVSGHTQMRQYRVPTSCQA